MSLVIRKMYINTTISLQRRNYKSVASYQSIRIPIVTRDEEKPEIYARW